ncbi:axonemal dynein light intermediate polypeptide 1-like [Brachionichthys hirsutus]|uniref:axonemal dynein light intermediate polypeptide 1-like n=1 Tax=Brachionichthys hirsutus TaxID=412623 RepID=UPI0036046738
MSPTTKSLLKYNQPTISKSTDILSPKDQPSSLVPPSQQFTGGASNAPRLEVLNSIFPPREWVEEMQLWVQQVSSVPCARKEIIQLKDQLDIELRQSQAKETGICPIRRELYSQLFDELIRQVTTNCAERGLLLMQVRNELKMTLDAYRTLYECSIEYGIRKAFQAEQTKGDLEQRNTELEKKLQDVMNQLRLEQLRCTEVENREREKAEIQGRKHIEEIARMTEINKQLKAQLEAKFAPEEPHTDMIPSIDAQS